jgi:hypothetical protein
MLLGMRIAFSSCSSIQERSGKEEQAEETLAVVIFVAVLFFGMDVRAHAQLATTITVKNTTEHITTLSLEGQTLADAFVVTVSRRPDEYQSRGECHVHRY